MGVLCSDDVVLERIVPFVTLCVEDAAAVVRATAIRCLRALLNSVTQINQVDSNIFKEFLFPVLNNMQRDPEPVVRVAFAESFGRFAETAMRFLDASRFNYLTKVAQSAPTITAENKSESEPSELPSSAFHLVDGSYDEQVNFLHEQVSKWIRDMVLDGAVTGLGMGGEKGESRGRSYGAIVKRAILKDIVRLCVFFGKQERIMDLFVQLLAYVNHAVSFYGENR
jgi:phosphoinositide-3-kinase, regulatory subunit 4